MRRKTRRSNASALIVPNISNQFSRAHFSEDFGCGGHAFFAHIGIDIPTAEVEGIDGSEMLRNFWSLLMALEEREEVRELMAGLQNWKSRVAYREMEESRELRLDW